MIISYSRLNNIPFESVSERLEKYLVPVERSKFLEFLPTQKALKYEDIELIVVYNFRNGLKEVHYQKKLLFTQEEHHWVLHAIDGEIRKRQKALKDGNYEVAFSPINIVLNRILVKIDVDDRVFKGDFWIDIVRFKKDVKIGEYLN